MKTRIENMLKGLMFEQNDQKTRDCARRRVAAILDEYSFDWAEVICDETNNTADVLKENKLIVGVNVRYAVDGALVSFNAEVGPEAAETFTRDELRSRKLVTGIFGTVDDLAAKFMYYDRGEDQDLPRGAIEQAVADGLITYEQIAARFLKALEE